jgi:L-ascorbate metabolism protein UlaG (beta-lactamase superfamily)
VTIGWPRVYNGAGEFLLPPAPRRSRGWRRAPDALSSRRRQFCLSGRNRLGWTLAVGSDYQGSRCRLEICQSRSRVLPRPFGNAVRHDPPRCDVARGHRVAPLPIAVPNLGRPQAGSGLPTVTWIGHSTVLVQLDGVSFLADPTWNTRSGPFGGRVGVSRYTPPGVRFEDMPQIDFVLISHDHYDHLDEPTVKRLAAAHNPRFIVPLGLKSWLADRGIENAVELNWGESVSIKGLTVVCTPAQHGSGRALADQGRRLWASWAVLGSKRFYFGGDTGYYRHFKDTGDALGPFDLAALPIGSYTPRASAKPVHISPERRFRPGEIYAPPSFSGFTGAPSCLPANLR